MARCNRASSSDPSKLSTQFIALSCSTSVQATR
jgi:hypothetical protein